MLTGKQQGILWTDSEGNGIQIYLDGPYEATYIRIIRGARQDDSYLCRASIRDVYDENQGTYVAGVELLDHSGRPTGEVYKLRDFQMSGNLSWYRPY